MIIYNMTSQEGITYFPIDSRYTFILVFTKKIVFSTILVIFSPPHTITLCISRDVNSQIECLGQHFFFSFQSINMLQN